MNYKYWEYFLSLESDLERCTRYIEFHPSNFTTFSIELAKIIMAASAEFENVAKDLCKQINPSTNPRNITDIYPIIIGTFSRFCQVEVMLPRYNIQFQPWSQWTENQRPDWWKNGYNAIKHSRDTSFDKATLENAIYSLGGLFTAVLYYHQKLSGRFTIDYSRRPTLYGIQEEPADYQDAELLFEYRLPL
jgi:hypothetical protein